MSYQHPIQRRQEIDKRTISAGEQFEDYIPRDSVDITIPDKLKSSCIGIWWLVGDDLIVFTDVVDGADNVVEEGVADGTYQLDYKRFHKDLWVSEGLADKYNQPAYDFYPRGRVIYSAFDDMFDIYTSKIYEELQSDDFIARLASAFNIPKGSYRAIHFYKSSADAYGK